ncbi:MAG TPA: VOC family protein [Chloroflexota bacterium]|jgi:catechol 2,3-dioxygenase-like lactoylglutathione lyase family enzyme|nr:VOC family protein [Chloroflexota bacterium]
MAAVTGLGHVGLNVEDIDRELWFFTELLGLTVSDRNEEGTTFFLSARPHEEHHELLLAKRPGERSSVQQISFTCSSLADLKEFNRKFVENGIKFDRVVSHGNAIGIYVRSPNDNKVEVYWHTGLDWPQPFGKEMDLTRPDEEILEHLTTGLPVAVS